MDRSDGKRKVNWFLIVGCLAIFAGLLALPALASVAAQISPWVAVVTVVALVGFLSLIVEEGWRHSPH